MYHVSANIVPLVEIHVLFHFYLLEYSVAGEWVPDTNNLGSSSTSAASKYVRTRAKVFNLFNLQMWHW